MINIDRVVQALEAMKQQEAYLAEQLVMTRGAVQVLASLLAGEEAQDEGNQADRND